MKKITDLGLLSHAPTMALMSVPMFFLAGFTDIRLFLIAAIVLLLPLCIVAVLGVIWLFSGRW